MIPIFKAVQKIPQRLRASRACFWLFESFQASFISPVTQCIIIYCTFSDQNIFSHQYKALWTTTWMKFIIMWLRLKGECKCVQNRLA